jgi:hypothetical protein
MTMSNFDRRCLNTYLTPTCKNRGVGPLRMGRKSAAAAAAAIAIAINMATQQRRGRISTS